MPKEPSQTKLVPPSGAMMRQPQVNTEIAVRDPESLLRYALDKNADVGVIERLMAVRKELQAEAAKAAFDDAMREFQSRCPVITKTTPAVGRDGRPMYHYAAMEKILSETQALRGELGFSHTFDTKVDAGWVECFCIVKHRGGHEESRSFKVPATSKSPMMNDPQMYASALTFLQRYTFCASFGIGTAVQDMDGRTSEQKPAGPSRLAPAETSLKDLAAELWTVLKPVRGEAKSWVQANQWLWKFELLDGATDEAAPNLTAERFREVIAKAKAQLV